MLNTNIHSIHQEGRGAVSPPSPSYTGVASLLGTRLLPFGRKAVTLLACLAGAGLVQAHAQAKPTATRAGDLQVGGGFTVSFPDYTHDAFKGIMGYATFDFKEHYGIEFNVHQVNASSPSKLYERTYELGGRYVRHYNIFHPYAKLMYGRGVFNYENDIANLAYNMGVVGAGFDVNVSRHVNVRLDYEYQNWFNFRGFISQGGVTENSASLSPQLITIGAAYHFQ